MGGRHECDIVGPNQLDCSYSGSNKSFSWSGCSANFSGGSHKTIMNHISSGAIPNFSNPSKPFNQCPTGTNNNNVTARILSNRCAVYNFNTNNSGFQVYINGPSYIYNSSQYFTWTPPVTGCNGSVTSYTWAYSTNGYSSTNFSYSNSASKRGNTFPYGFRTVFIKLTVQCSNGETATRVKPITNYSFYNYAVYSDTYLKSKSIQDDLDDDIKVVISPNPASNSFQLELWNPREGEIRYSIVRENGQIVKTDAIVARQGIVHMKINSEDYYPGVYWIQIISEHDFQSHPLIIQN